jgi:PKD repeat protein
MNRILFFLLSGSLLTASGVGAQENIHLVTYGPAAPTQEGDDDFQQIVFIQIPEAITDSLYLRIFDLDCAGDLDLRFGDAWDTETRFALYGGVGAFSAPTAQSPFPRPDDLTAGALIAEDLAGENPLRNNEWYNLARFLPSRGEKINGAYFFKLVIRGMNGNDANVFDVRVSLSENQNRPPAAARLFTYAPTIRLTKKDPFASVRCFVPDNVTAILAHNFDLAGAEVAFETALRSNLLVTSSGQGEWVKNTIALEKLETGRMCAISFGQGGETPNDATFYVTDEAGNALPIDLPIFTGKPNRRPVIQKKILPLSDCYSVVFDAKESTDVDGDVLEFFWDFGKGEIAKGSRVVHRYADYGRYEATLIVTDNSGQVGNSSVQRFPVVVNKPPLAEAGANLVAALGETIRLEGSASKDDDGKLQKFSWEFGDGSAAEGPTASHVYAQPQTYRVALRVEDDSDSPCNFDADSLTVWINAPPLAEAGQNVVSSAGKAIRFDASASADSDGELVNYLWDFGDGEQDAGKIVAHSYKKPGNYTATLTIKDNANVKNSTAVDRLTVIINHPPVARAGNDARIAVDEALAFNGSNSSDADGRLINYLWSFGDGATASGASASHGYKAPGKYAAVLTVKDDSGTDSATASDTMMVTVNAPPIADAGENQIVTASEVKLDATASKDPDGAITRYTWDFGDGSGDAEASPVHVYSKPGTYRVQLAVVDDSNTKNNQSADDVEVVVNEKPIADAGPDQIAATGQEIIFDAAKSFDPDGAIAAYAWNFGDGQQAASPKAAHRYAQPGIYTARLTVQDNTGHAEAVDFDEAIITVNAPPVAIAGKRVIAAPDQAILFDGKASYDADGKIISHRWDFSDEQSGADVSQTTRKFSKPGIYSAGLTVKDNSGASNAVARDTVLVRINNAPIAQAGKNLVTCQSAITFDASASTDPDGDPLTYSWDFGDGSRPDSGVKVIHHYAKAGVYPVILAVDDGLGLPNSRHANSITVKINQPPTADAGKHRTLCAGDVVIFDGGNSRDPEGGLLKYTWDFGDGTSAEGINPTKIYKQGGVYQVKLLVEDDSGLPCNTAIDTKVVTVAESPVAIAGPDVTVCANTEVKFDGTPSRDFDGVVNSYFWDFGDGTTGGGATPTKAYKKSGAYRVVLTITGDQIGDCDNTDTDEVLVNVYEAPVAQFTCPAIFPIHRAAPFDASASTSLGSAIVSYTWDFGDGATGAGKTATHAYTRAGTFIPVLTIKSDAQTSCNVTTAQRVITINAPPVAEAGADQLVGVNQPVVFDGSASKDADGSITAFHWTLGDGAAASGVQVRHQFPKAGRFPIVLKVTDNTDLANNSDADTAMVTVNAAPAPLIDMKPQACPGEMANFNGARSMDADGQIVSHRWDFGDGQSADGPQATHAYARPGLYNVTLTVDDGTPAANRKSEVTKTILINNAPIAMAGPDQVICPGAAVPFDASLSGDRDGRLKSYAWNFGDGTQHEGKTATHIYQKPGRYEARLTVTDDNNTGCSTSADVIVVTVNAAPRADAGPDREAFTGGAHDAVLFDGTMSSDPDGDPLTYSWDFGDGTSKPGAKLYHTFAKPGRYAVRLTVNDGKRAACSLAVDEVIVLVQERAGNTSHLQKN